MQGVEKFKQEIDIVNYAKSLRLLKILLSSLMDDSEKYLSTYHQQNWLKLIDCERCKTSVPKKQGLPRLMSTVIELETHVKNVDEFFKDYTKEQFSAKDYRLLKGVYWNEDLNNDELSIIRPDKNDSHDSELSNIKLGQSISHVAECLSFDHYINE